MNKRITILLAFLFCSVVFPQRFEEIINPVKISADETDSVYVRDLFYADKYNPVFDQNENISLTYNPDSELLYLKTSEYFEGLTNIRFTSGTKEMYLPVSVTVKQIQQFSYTPDGKPAKVNLFGSFNSWNREEYPMTDNDGDGVYDVSIPVEPGRYEYKFFVDGKEVVDPANPDKISNGMGDFNSIINVEPRHHGSHSLHLTGSYSNENSLILIFTFDNDRREIAFTADNIFCYLNNTLLGKEYIKIISPSADNTYEVALPAELLEGNVTFRSVVSQGGRVTNWQTIKLTDGKQAGGNSFIWEDAIIYSLMIDRFNDGDKSNSIPVDHPELHTKTNYNGGDLQGVIDKLNEGYFDSLGINTLWISPVIQNTNAAYREYPAPHRYFTAYHGYWPVHPTNVEEKFGDMALLKKLISTAQSRNIKVLLDYVANHIHIEHPFYKEHPDWFGTLELPDGRKNLRLWDEQRLTTWFEPYMPSFDYSGSREALDYMTDNAVWWLKETGADGFRHDAVKHVPNEFWRELTRKIKKEIEIPSSVKVYQVGETFGSYELVSDYVNNGQLDAQFDFNLYDTSVPAFSNPEVPFRFLDDKLKKTLSVFGSNHLMGNVMDSHDKVRFMAYADGDIDDDADPIELGWTNPPQVDNESSYSKLKIFMAYLMSIPGIPIVYYGDEIGMTGAADPDNRRMMRFNDEVNEIERQTMKDASQLIKIRKENSALRYGDFHTLLVEDNVYAYIRSDVNQRVIVLLNKGNAAADVNISLPEYYNIGELTDLINNNVISVKGNTLSVSLQPLSYGFYKTDVSKD